MKPGDTLPSPPPPEPEPERTVVRGARPREGLPEIAGVRLEGEIARGGMGVVYRGVQEYLSRPVAVKVLAAHLHAGDFVARFQREARILSGIAHPHIVGCHQAGVTEAGQCFMVMEFIDGPSLRRHVAATGPVPVAAVLRMGAALARALDHAWQAGVIHRDVKPENVVLQKAPKAQDQTFPFVPKLVDLGLARADSVADGLTAPGAVMGTYSTMAPEQFDAPDAVDFRADLYGLGCVLYFALTGEAAFPQASMALVIQRKLASPAPDPCEVNQKVPAAVGALVQAMLAADRERRPASYEAVVARCEELLAGRAAGAADARTVVEPGPAEPAVAASRRRAPFVAGAVVLVLAGSAAAWFWPKAEGAPKVPPVVDGNGVDGNGVDGNGDAGTKPGTDGDKTVVKPPPPRVPPTLSVQAPAQIGPGETLILQAHASDADTPELTFHWEQVSGGPTVLSGPEQSRADVTLPLCVPGSDLVFAVSVSDGDHAPVRQEVRVAVVDEGAVPLFPAALGDKLTNWVKADTGAGTWATYAEFVVNGFCKDGITRLRTELPEGDFALFGKVELVPDFATKKLPTAAGLMLRQADGEGALALWAGPVEGGLVHGGLGAVEAVDDWPPQAVSEGIQWPQPAVMHFRVVATGAALRFVWGAGNEWKTTKLDRPPGSCCLELFVRDGLAHFHDVRR